GGGGGGQRGGVAPGGFAPHVPEPTRQPVVAQGQVLLEKARLELRAGQLTTARHLAEDACQPQYGVRDQAMALLRSIDTEESRQRYMTSRRTFDAVVSAYNRHDYARAGALLGTIDTHLLDPERLAKLKEMQLTADMHPATATQVVQVSASDRSPATPTGTPPAVTTSRTADVPAAPRPVSDGLPGGAAGRATVTDRAEDSLLSR